MIRTRFNLRFKCTCKYNLDLCTMIFLVLLQVENLDLKPLVSHEKAPVVIHGTYQNSWEKIKLTVSFIFMYMSVSEIY